MFHQLEISEPQSIFRYLPVLSFTESYIYQVIAVYLCSVKLRRNRNNVNPVLRNFKSFCFRRWMLLMRRLSVNQLVNPKSM